jgi:diazepam-binding inhibitor (GABA receptor modulator, acyl-CoA-binding protein)
MTEMIEIKARFEQAAQEAQRLSKKPDNETLLKLYALYKQATAGVVGGKRPGMLDMVGRAKFDAWQSMKGTSREDAMQAYIDLVEKLKG